VDGACADLIGAPYPYAPSPSNSTVEM
jgi:hypothetical protein